MTFALLATVLVLAAPQPAKKGGPAPAFAGLNTPPPAEAAFAVLVTFGLKDNEPKPWDGSVRCDTARVLKCEGWRFGPGSQCKQPVAWVVTTQLGPIAPTPVGKADQPKDRTTARAPLPVGVVIYFDTKPTGSIHITTQQDEFDIKPADLALGNRLMALDGAVAIEEVPVPRAPASEPGHADYASVMPCTGGSLRLATVLYTNASDRVVYWTRDADGHWSEPQDVSAPAGDCFGTTQAGNWIVWSQREGREWNLMGRQWTGGKLGEPVAIVRGAGANIFHALAAGPNGVVWLAWQGFRNGKSCIFAKRFDGREWSIEIQLSHESGNCWMPSIAADSKGSAVVAWDTYEGGSYNIRACFIHVIDVFLTSPAFKVTQSPLFQAHASVAFDKQDRAWIAWDESGANWGKDTGFLIPKTAGTRLYQGRTIRIASLDGDGNLTAPLADIHSVLPESKLFNDQVQTEVCELPKLIVDGAGRLWCFLRHRLCKVPREDGWAAIGLWEILATRYDGKSWSAPVFLPHSNGRNDASLDLKLAPDGAVWAAWQTDNRAWAPPQPRKGDVFVTSLGGAATSPTATLASKPWQPPAPLVDKPTHPNEPADVTRVRAYTANIGGKALKIYRGDLHRHTEQSIDGPGDGSLWDLYRYAIDAAGFDYIMVTDHNDGDDHEYQWWRREKSNDLFFQPGAFTTLFGYERSVQYPNGHRNCIFAERGVRTLPISKEELHGELNSGPIVYPYLRQFKGICTLHTSATEQGTDWRDNDPQLEPVVEIYQGYHTSYEADGAPKTVNARTDTVHGPYKPLGFVWLALAKGYRLGFQASSDHISTHVSYACVFSDDFSRQGIIDAIKKRHTYAATDNLIVETRMGGHFMGDEFDVTGPTPALEVKAVGTSPIKQIEVIKNNVYVFTYKPKPGETTSSFTFNDSKAADTASAYYYVRVEQLDGQMAWASPIWVNRK
jgi:hypothetical protein